MMPLDGEENESSLDPKVAQYLMQKKAQMGGDAQMPPTSPMAEPGPLMAQNVPEGQKTIAEYMRGGSPQPSPQKDLNPNSGGIHFMDRALAGANGKKVPQRVQYNKDLNKTRIIWSDGQVEERDGYHAKPTQ